MKEGVRRKEKDVQGVCVAESWDKNNLNNHHDITGTFVVCVCGVCYFAFAAKIYTEGIWLKLWKRLVFPGFAIYSMC